MSYSEFQAVVLAAGRGCRMVELTVGRPKCLLPVGKDPILIQTLQLISNAGFKDVIVVVLKTHYTTIQQILNQYSVKLHVDLVEIPADEDWGTADSLRYLMNQKKVVSDVLLVSCDLFTNGNINSLMHTFRKHKAAFCAQFYLPYDGFDFADPLPGIKSKHKPERDIIGIDKNTQRLTFLASTSDFEESVFLSRNILNKHPRLSLRTDLVDGHIYLIARGLAEYLASESTFSTLKGEFFPHVVKKQQLRTSKTDQDNSGLMQPVEAREDIGDVVQELSTYTDHKGDLQGAYHGDTLRSYAVLAKPDVYGLRVNTVSALCQANRLVSHHTIHIVCSGSQNVLAVCTRVINILNYWKTNQDGSEIRLSPSAVVESTQIDRETFVGAGCVIKDKTSIKSSTIGDNCVINSKTRVSNTIIFKKINIGERCVIDNCIICDEAVIGAECELKNCIVGAFHSVPDKTKMSFQVLTKSDGLMEIE